MQESAEKLVRDWSSDWRELWRLNLMAVLLVLVLGLDWMACLLLLVQTIYQY